MNQDKPSILKNKNGIIFFIAEVSFMLPYFNFYELVSGSYRTLFLVDFKVGFCSRAFIGEIVRLLTDNVTQQFLCAFALFNILLYLGMFSAMAGKVTYKASGKEAILVICTLFAVSRCSLRFYFSGSWTTIFDNFWLTALAFALVCIRYKSIKWMVPIVCVWSIGVHYGFIFSFLPCILAILLFEIYANKRNRIYNTIVFFVTALSSALSGIYFILFAPNNVNLTKQQAHEYLQGGFSEPLSFDLFDSYFYVQSNNGEKFSSMREMIVYWFKTFSGFELSTFLVILPAVLIFAAFWVYIFKRTKDKAYRCLVLLNIVMPIFCVPNIIVSTDRLRFCIPMLITQIIIILYYFYFGEPNVTGAINKISAFIKTHFVETISLCTVWVIYSELECSYLSIRGLQFICCVVSAMLIYKDKKYYSLIPAAAGCIMGPNFFVIYGPVLAIICMCKTLILNTLTKKRNLKEKYSLPMASIYFLFSVASVLYFSLKENYKITLNSFKTDTAVCVAVMTACFILFAWLVILKKRPSTDKNTHKHKAFINSTVLFLTYVYVVLIYLFSFSNLSADTENSCRYAACVAIPVVSFLFNTNNEIFTQQSCSGDGKNFSMDLLKLLIPAGASVLVIAV